MIIVTCVDGSQATGSTARTAAMLAGVFDAELVLVCTCRRGEVDHRSGVGEGATCLNEASARKAASETVRSLTSEFPQIRFTVENKEGEPAQALVRVAEDADADIIVVGNRRATGTANTLERLAVDVARTASCDVYVAQTYMHPRASDLS